MEKELLPHFAWYEPRHRHRADSIIKWLQQRAGKHERFIAITTLDISTQKGKIKDYGVMGLAYLPGKACVASSYRLKDKTNFYKVVIHELAHTNGLPHCSDKNCYLRDAKGGDHTSEEKSFCKKCERTLKERGWHF
jgi:archaemetzincin